MPPFTIALPIGRLGDASLDFLRRSGVANFSRPDGRALSFLDTTGAFRVILVRNRDVAEYVLHGGADVGIAGRDDMAERGYDLTVPLELGFGNCRLVLAAQERAFALRQHVRVATKYPRLTQDYFFRQGVSCEVLKLHGSIEIAPLLGLADCIVDIVQSGATLRANGLLEVATLLESTAVLVAPRATFALKTERMSLLLDRMRAATEEEGRE